MGYDKDTECLLCYISGYGESFDEIKYQQYVCIHCISNLFDRSKTNVFTDVVLTCDDYCIICESKERVGILCTICTGCGGN